MIGNRKIVALCISSVHEYINYRFVACLNKYLTSNGYNLLVYNLSTDMCWVNQILAWHNITERADVHVFDLINYGFVEAVVIMDEKIRSNKVNEEIIAKAKNKNVPVIIVDGEGSDCINLNFDYKAGFYDVVKHVLEVHKPKNVHYMAGVKGNRFSEERGEVLFQLLDEYNIPHSENDISYGDFWGTPTAAAMEKLMQSKELPDAIICANDNMAINVCGILNKYGYKVPNDIIVTGFDGIPEAFYGNPQLTTSNCNFEAIAEYLGEIIVKDIAEGKAKTQYYFKPKLIIAHSCGCDEEVFIEFSHHFNNSFYKYTEEEYLLNEAVGKVHIAGNLSEASDIWQKYNFTKMWGFINRSCLDSSLNPSMNDLDGFDRKMVVFCSPNEDYRLKEIDMILEFDKILSQMLENNQPIIFMELDYLNKTMGLLCYNIPVENSGDYFKIPQITFAMNSAIGGYRNIQHQNYLMKKNLEVYQHDLLTGLLTRNAFAEKFNEVKKEIIRNKSSFAMVLMDLDGLKYINDTYGHSEGDNAIYTASTALKFAVSPDSITARYGGDEIVAFIPHECVQTDIKQYIKTFLSGYNVNSSNLYKVSVSTGIYVSSNPDDLNIQLLIEKADELMYIEKKIKKVQRNN